MPELGGNNPFPFELGGGKSTTEQIYSNLKDAVGEGGSAEDGTIEAQWRMAQARGFRAARSVQRAMNQNFPDLATDLIPYWEELYKISPGDASDEERRQAISDRYSRQIDASGPGIDERLQEIDALFSVVARSFESSTTTINGRGFQDYTPADPDACGPAFGGGRESTNYPNYSDHFICRINYAIPAGTPSAEAQARIRRATDVLIEVLPAWVDFNIITGVAGFYLDISLLDIGSFN